MLFYTWVRAAGLGSTREGGGGMEVSSWVSKLQHRAENWHILMFVYSILISSVNTRSSGSETMMSTLTFNLGNEETGKQGVKCIFACKYLTSITSEPPVTQNEDCSPPALSVEKGLLLRQCPEPCNNTNFIFFRAPSLPPSQRELHKAPELLTMSILFMTEIYYVEPEVV